jgi:hypothetical protein
MTDTCSTCAYWISGGCHLTSPLQVRSSFSGWPKTAASDWCGHWSATANVGSCSTCAYWLNTACHLNIPQSPDGTFSGWPQTKSTDWCGRWSIGINPQPYGISFYYGTTVPTALPDFGINGDWYVLQAYTGAGLWTKISGTWNQIQPF